MEKQLQQKMLSNIELSNFCEQMALILKAGISAIEGISILREDAQTKDEQELLTMIYEQVLECGQLYPALLATKVFPDYLLHMVNAGEETGRLDEVMASLSRHYSREEVISQNIKNALTYPLIMIGMMLLVILILITQVMPVFEQVFQQLGREMTGVSKGILILGNTLSNYAIVFLIIAVLVVVGLLYFTKNQNGRKQLRTLGHHFKFSRAIYDKMAACRFAGGMSLALKSGLIPQNGLELSEALVEDTYFKDKIIACRNLVNEGTDLAKAFQETNIFTGVQARMASIAEKSGAMDEMIEHIATQYEEEVEEKISSFISILEPTLVVVLSVIVGIILLSVMLPLLGIMTGM